MATTAATEIDMPFRIHGLLFSRESGQDDDPRDHIRSSYADGDVNGQMTTVNYNHEAKKGRIHPLEFTLLAQLIDENDFM